MMQPKRALPELSLYISITNLHPAVVKLLASKVAIGTYGQTRQTTLVKMKQNSIGQMASQSCFYPNFA